jgi:hypothetical protein
VSSLAPPVLVGGSSARSSFSLTCSSSRRPLPLPVGPETRSVTTHFRVAATLPDGRPYTNAAMQFLRLRFGRVVEDRIYEDTQRLAAALDEVVAQRAGDVPARALN